MNLELIKYEPGMKVSQPGVYAGMPLHVYHSQCCVGPSVSSSGLRDLFLSSPAHFWSESTMNPKRVEKKDTKFMVLGGATPPLFLGGADFEKSFIRRPATYANTKNKTKALPRQSKTCKEWEANAEL